MGEFYADSMIAPDNHNAQIESRASVPEENAISNIVTRSDLGSGSQVDVYTYT